MTPRARLWVHAFLFVLFAAPARAEPITARYVVAVTERCDAQGCLPPIHSTFLLSVTFDTTAVVSEHTPTFHHVQYGFTSTFSGIPLPRRPIDPSARIGGAATEIAVFLESPDRPSGSPGWRQIGGIQQGAFLRTESQELMWHLGLFRAVDLSEGEPPPLMSPATLIRFLDGADFSYSFSGRSRLDPDVFTPDSVGYRGTVSLAATPDPIPEPTTIALVGIGLAVIASKGRRRST